MSTRRHRARRRRPATVSGASAGGNIGAARSVSLDMERPGDSDRERFALAALESVELVAPPRLRARIEAERERARRPARRRRLGAVGRLRGRGARRSCSRSCWCSRRRRRADRRRGGRARSSCPPTGARRPARRARLPDWAKAFGWRATGRRRRRARRAPGRHGLLREEGPRARLLDRRREVDPVAGGLEARRGGRHPLRPSRRGTAGWCVTWRRGGRAQLRPVGLRSRSSEARSSWPAGSPRPQG